MTEDIDLVQIGQDIEVLHLPLVKGMALTTDQWDAVDRLLCAVPALFALAEDEMSGLRAIVRTWHRH